jgi:hypothetical protein
MQRPGSAEGDEGEVARVVAAFDRDHAHGADHVVVGNGQNAPRRRLEIEAQGLGNGHDGALGRLDVEHHLAPEEPGR